MNEQRRLRLESLIQHLLSQLISRQEVKDHRVGTDVSLTWVKMSKDGAYADVYVSSFQSANHSVKGAEGLNSAAGFIRRKLAPKLRLRKIPNFRFHPDYNLQMAVVYRGANHEARESNEIESKS